jgi:hypothetical protein
VSLKKTPEKEKKKKKKKALIYTCVSILYTAPLFVNGACSFLISRGFKIKIAKTPPTTKQIKT